MKHGWLVGALVAGLVAVPTYFVIKKRTARSSLDDLLAERFTARPCVVATLPVPSGGTFHCREAYTDKTGSGLVLVVGVWDRGTISVRGGVAAVSKLSSGVFKPNADAAWTTRMRPLDDVIIADPVDGGAIVIWDQLPNRDSVMEHLAAAR